ncbi:hypothetical protein KAM471_39760 [Aeromonas caviae]|nr:hypothetical protein KAM471_39760 [Aeromonas caviae]
MKLGIKSAAAALLATLVLVGCGQKEENKYLFTRTGLTASVLPGWDNLSSRCTP